jgi:hypothetical protein
MLRQLSGAAMLLAALSGRSFGQAAGARIDGVVTDSINRRPLTGATVIATPDAAMHDSVFHSALSDSRGRFTLGDLGAGRYALTVEHPFIDSTGIGALPRDVTLTSGGVASVALGIPSANTLRRTFCPGVFEDSSLGVSLGVVRRMDGTPVGGATVVLSWSDFDVDRTTGVAKPRQLTVNAKTDPSGVYRACGLPVARSLLMQAQSGADMQSGVIEEQIGLSGVLVRDLHIGTQVATQADSAKTSPAATLLAPTGRFAVSGRIQSSRGQPVPSAQVHLFGTSRVAASGDDGDFRLSGLPGGTQGLEILALGYYPRRVRVEVADGMRPITVKLEPMAAVLDSIRVTAKRVYSGDGNRQFDTDMKRGFGRFVTEDEIAKRHPFVVSDILRMMSGFGAAVSPGTGAVMLVQNHGISTLRGVLPHGGASNPTLDGATGGKRCPAVYLDGVELADGDADSISPMAIYGIEVYRLGEAPARYDDSCGAVLIWTK